MAGIWSGLKDSITGGGGAPGSPIPREVVSDLTPIMLDNLRMSRMVANVANTREEAKWSTQQDLLPLVMQQLGYEVSPTNGYWGNPRYVGTEQQNALDAMARTGSASLPAQYANLGYDVTQNPDGSYTPTERADSQRNVFVDAMGRRIDQSQALYDEFLRTVQGAQGGQQEALDATRRQLQTAEAYQPAALQRLGFGRDASGNIYNDANSTMGQYEQELLRQMGVARGTQGASLQQLGFQVDANGNVQFDPNSSVGQLFANYDRQLQDARQQTGIAENTQGASLQRLGLMQDAQGNWINDPAGNEMMMRQLQADYLRRANAAMQGNAPVDPGVERAISEERRLLNETMTRQLGPGWETSSPGMEMLRNFEQRANETRYKVQQDALGLGTTQAMNLQGTNLQTLASLYSSNDPVLRAMAAEAAIAGQGLQARQSNAVAASGVSAQGAQTIGNLAGTQSGINAQTLASLYGLTAPALAAAGQMGNLVNQNQVANTAAYGQLGTLGQQTAANINARAQGALGFQQANTAALAGIPANAQQLYGNAQAGRMNSLAALYPAVNSAYEQGDKFNLANLYGQLGSAAGGLLTGTGGQIMSGDQTHFQTNINNLFWQNLMKSGGQFVGSGMGYGGPNAKSGGGGGSSSGVGLMG